MKCVRGRKKVMFNYEFKRSTRREKTQEQTHEYEKRVSYTKVMCNEFTSSAKWKYIVEAQQHSVVLAPAHNALKEREVARQAATCLHSNESVLNEFIKVHRI